MDQAVDGLRVAYSLEVGENIQLLDSLQWADWDRDGHLLVATRSGKIQILDRDVEGILFEEDLSLLKTQPVSAPSWAQQW